MAQPLRKEIGLSIGGRSVTVPVDFRAVEAAETVYGMGADFLAVELQYPVNLVRTKIGRVIAMWSGGDPDEQQAAYEYVCQCPTEEFQKFVGSVQAALLFCLKFPIDDAEFDRLTEGKDLAGAEPPKKKRGRSSAKSTGSR